MRWRDDFAKKARGGYLEPWRLQCYLKSGDNSGGNAVGSVTGKKILLVDDEDVLRQSLGEQLRLHEEFDTREADTGTQALELAKSEYFDAIILDVGLPDMDGREVCRLMRRNGVKSHHQRWHRQSLVCCAQSLRSVPVAYCRPGCLAS